MQLKSAVLSLICVSLVLTGVMLFNLKVLPSLYTPGLSLSSITRTRLSVLTEIASESSKIGFVFNEATTTRELVEFAMTRRLITQRPLEMLIIDAWRKPIRIVVFQERGVQTVAIISPGPNLLFENGSGDDIVIRVTIRNGN